MHESPRLRRLRNDLAALGRLREESTVLRFSAAGKPAQQYTIEFRGRGLAYHLHILFAFHKRLESCPDQLMVVEDEDANRHSDNLTTPQPSLSQHLFPAVAP